MEAADARRAVATAMSVATSLDLAVDRAVVLNDSNRLVVRLLPCDVVARVSPLGWFSATREVELVRRLAEGTAAPVAGLDPRVEPRVHERDGFEIALWTAYEPVHAEELPAADYAHALERLHRALGLAARRPAPERQTGRRGVPRRRPAWSAVAARRRVVVAVTGGATGAAVRLARLL